MCQPVEETRQRLPTRPDDNWLYTQIPCDSIQFNSIQCDVYKIQRRMKRDLIKSIAKKVKPTGYTIK